MRNIHRSGDSIISRVPLRTQSWEIAADDLDIEGCIGMGSNHVRVYKGLWKEVLEVAIKEIPKSAGGDRLSEEIVKEVTVLIHMRHPNVLHFYGMTEDDHSYKLVMEYCERGSLMDLLRKANATPNLKAQLHWHRRLEIAQNIAAGMAFLHAHNVLHRDLKSPNVLLTQKLDVKVADFGFSRFCDNIEQYTTSSTPMNLRWLAPEILEDSETGKTSWAPAADIFSYGVIMWELLTFKFPFADMDNMRLMIKANMGTLELPIPPVEEIPGGHFPSLKDYIRLMQECLCKRQSGRPKSFLQIVQRLKAMIADSFPRGRPSTPDSSRRSTFEFSAPRSNEASQVPQSSMAATTTTAQTNSINQTSTSYNTTSAYSPPLSAVESEASPFTSELPQLPSFDPNNVPIVIPASYVESSPSPFGALDSQPSEFVEAAPLGKTAGTTSFAGFTSAMNKVVSKLAESSPFGRAQPPPSSEVAAPRKTGGIGNSIKGGLMAVKKIGSSKQDDTSPPKKEQEAPSTSTSAAPSGRSPLQPIQQLERGAPSRPGSSNTPQSMPSIGSQASPFSAFDQGPVFPSTDFPDHEAPGHVSPRRTERAPSVSFREYKANVSSSPPTAVLMQGPGAAANRVQQPNRSAPANFPVDHYSSVQVGHAISPVPANFHSSVPTDVHQERTYKDAIEKFLWWFNEIDNDGSGTIDAEELSKSLPDDFGNANEKNAVLIELIERFQEVDQNNDGVIDRAEFMAAAGKLLQKQLRRRGRLFDEKLYEMECKTILSSMPKSRVMSVDCFDAAVYKALVDDYIRWFREFDSDANDSISIIEIQDYLRKNNHNPAIPKDQLSILSTLYRRFKEFDSNGDGVIDKHEYLHMCARLLTEEHQRQGFAVDETRCRYHLYFYALNLNGHTMYKDVPRNAARAVDIKADDQDLQLQLLCDDAAREVLGRVPRKYDSLDNTQFRRVLSKLSDKMKAAGLP